MADGPRALRPDEWQQLHALESAVFRPEMFENYPQLFNEQNRQNLRVVAEDGMVVCQVGMTQRDASLAGCRIRVCCIGAVATYESHRGRGYASLAFQDCCDKAAADGVDVMMISGGRGLYTRVGCRQVGRDLDFALAPDQVAALSALRAPGGAAYQLEALDVSRAREIASLYQGEPARFLRPLEDWQLAFQCGNVMNTLSEFWGVVAGEALLAYAIVHHPDRVRRRNPDDPRTARVVEFAGDRTALAAALPLLLERYGAGRLTLHVQGTDAALARLLATAGLVGTPNGTSGTLRVINFPQLMERCRPLLVERIGSGAADLRFEAEERPGSALGSFSVRLGDEVLRIPDLASLALYLFGTTKEESPAVEGSARIAKLLAQALPLPTLWYGISYV